jgi:hypothetical protein
MRKAFGIVIGCALFCGLVMAAMLAQAVRPPKAESIQINLNDQTEGVDKPWFELSRSAEDTVQWTNNNDFDCTVSFGKKRFLNYRDIPVPRKGQSIVLHAKDAPAPPPGWPSDRVYLFYKYSVNCGDAGYFDPGGGMKP